MTREEAIAYGKRVIDLGLNDETQAFCEMAIEALELEPCDDAISKQAVLDTTICGGISCNECSFNTCEDGQAGCLLKERVDKLPSVTPHYTDAEIQRMQELEQAELEKAYELGKASQPKTGQWIDDCGGAKCSCCGYCIDDYYYVKTYCPNCGAKMQEVEE